MKKLHFKLFRYILSRPYPFNHWLILLTTYTNLWFYSTIYSSILCHILETTFVEFIKFYFVFNFFIIIFIVFYSYKFQFFRLVYHTADQLFRNYRKIIWLKINYDYKPIDKENIFLDFDNERSKIFEKKYEEIDFLVLNDYITIKEGNKKD